MVLNPHEASPSQAASFGKATFSPILLSTFKMSSNNELDKFKGDGIQDVNAWFTNYEQWTNVHDLHYLKTTPLLAVKEHPLTCSLYIFNVLASH